MMEESQRAVEETNWSELQAALQDFRLKSDRKSLTQHRAHPGLN